MWGNLLSQVQKKLDDAVELLKEDDTFYENDEEYRADAAAGDGEEEEGEEFIANTPAASPMLRAGHVDDEREVAHKTVAAEARAAVAFVSESPSSSRRTSLLCTRKAGELPESAATTSVAAGVTDRCKEVEGESGMVTSDVAYPTEETSLSVQPLDANALEAPDLVVSKEEEQEEEEPAATSSSRRDSVITIAKVGVATAESAEARTLGAVSCADNTFTAAGMACAGSSSTALPNSGDGTRASKQNMGLVFTAAVAPLVDVKMLTSDILSSEAAVQQRSPELSSASGEAQLLRFQEKLAEEMQSNAALMEENRSLSERLAAAIETERQLAEEQRGSARQEELSTLIEKLGKAKEHSKALSDERKALREKVRRLEEDLGELRSQEANWRLGQEEQRQHQSATHSRIVALEDEVRTKDARLDDLELKLSETQRERDLLMGKLQQAQRSHQEAVSEIRESNTDTLESLRREVDHLKAALNNSAVEFDLRTSELENEVLQATRRAHMAESRLNDMEHSSVGSLHGLRRELEDTQARMLALGAETSVLREEYEALLEKHTALRHARAAEGAQSQQKQDALSAVRVEVAALAQKLAHMHEALQSWQVKAEEAQRAQRTLEATNAQLSAQLEQVKQQGLCSRGSGGIGDALPRAGTQMDALAVTITSDTLSVSDLVSPAFLVGSNGGMIADAEVSAIGSRRNPRAVPPVPIFSSMGRDGGGNGGVDGAGGSSSSFGLHGGAAGGGKRAYERLENELVRQAVEIERLRKEAATAKELQSRLQNLTLQHDLLLQMYGQVEEDVKRLSAEKATATAPAAAATAVATDSVDVAATAVGDSAAVEARVLSGENIAASNLS